MRKQWEERLGLADDVLRTGLAAVGALSAPFLLALLAGGRRAAALGAEQAEPARCRLWERAVLLGTAAGTVSACSKPSPLYPMNDYEYATYRLYERADLLM